MAKRSILHLLDPMPNNSPFDINMALDINFDVLMPYSNVKLDSIHALTQDIIFSRSPAGIKRTGIFIGGRDVGLAMDMMNTAKQAMLPPFAVSILADPSGAFTTAAALVACVEKELKDKHNKVLKDCRAAVFGGTGSVGIATGVIASLAGADTILVDHVSVDAASSVAKEYNRRYKSTLSGVIVSSDEEKIALLTDVDIIFCAAKAGIQVISADVLAQAGRLKVAGDVNAVPPAGLEGIAAKDFGVPLIYSQDDAVGIGALAIGNIKYQVQRKLLQRILEATNPVYLDFREAFIEAQGLL